jgi:PKHD-type hydroxylase
MAHLACWHVTQLPIEMVEILKKDLEVYDQTLIDSHLAGTEIDKVIRDSKNSWIPTSHWVAGWIWYYIEKSNRENFRYDIVDIDGGHIQYTQYGEGQFYNWHQDADIDTCYSMQTNVSSFHNQKEDQSILQGEYVRKLSFSLQLSDPKDYIGGEVQFMNNSNKTFFAPKQLGTLIIFDSRTKHRVRKINSGVRKSLVGWVVGPRWK